MKNKMLTMGLVTPLLLMGCAQTPSVTTTTTTPAAATSTSKDSTATLTVNPAPSTEQTQSDPQQAAPSSKMSAEANELLLTKVKLAALSEFKTEDTFQAGDLNKFVFVTRTENRPEATESVGIYDVTKDQTYHSGGDVTLDAATTVNYIYTENLANTDDKAMTFHALGMDGSKLIIWETGVDNSPGPCANIWIDDSGTKVVGSNELTYIDINDAKPTRKAYVVPQTKVDEAIKEQQKCEKDMNLGN